MSSGGQSEKLFGHPTGLYTLFFAEMWERFSYYGMRALLVFYMIKGFLGYGDSDAYGVYGAYTALVYMTPFFGGMLADRLLGQRKAVILGGLMMAAGHLTMTLQTEPMFFLALAMLIAGNGFFKPNISSMVGTLYPGGSPRRDGGFTIFYMGVNLGASMAPLLCGYVGETYGWHYGFGLATIGMLIGLAVFVAPTRVTQLLIMSGAVAGAIGLITYVPDNPWSIALNVFVALALLTSGIVSWMALARGGLPDWAGQPPKPEDLKAPGIAGLNKEWTVYIATILLVPVIALFVSGFSGFNDGKAVSLIGEDVIESLEGGGAFSQISAVVVAEISKPAGLVLAAAGILALIYLLKATFRLDKIRRERMFVVLILTFFSMLFWSFFEQAGSSINNFTDRNVDRTAIERTVEPSELGSTLALRPTQLQLGYTNGQAYTFVHSDGTVKDYLPKPPAAESEAEEDPAEEPEEEGKKEKVPISEFELRIEDRPQVFVLDMLTDLRDFHDDPEFTIDWIVMPDNVGTAAGDAPALPEMPLAASRNAEVPASTFQAVNAICILLFGLVFTGLWGWLATRKKEPSTPFKFASGLLQLGLGFVALWYGAETADERGMVHVSWLVVGYLLHTTGELCLSPVGLSMVTKLSPKILVSTVMGNWFLATAFSQYLAAIISQFTGVSEGGGDESGTPVPMDTVDTYGGVFGKIAIAAIGSALICYALTPLLKKWIHEGVEAPGDEPT